MKTNAKTNQNTSLNIPQNMTDNKPKARRGRPPKAGKTTIINGGKFTNCFNEVTIETPLESLDKWELRRLYQNNDGVREEARKKYQLECLKEFETYIYRNISRFIQAIETDINKSNMSDTEKTAMKFEELQRNENGELNDKFFIEYILVWMGQMIESRLNQKSDKEIQKYFTNNVSDIFDTSKYVVDKDFNVYEKLRKLFA